ncbi:hypothetical protein V1512DRAFT_262361 [Lipomyces arxii]|uniref:uncharacterized protein n=1 Tax=Lipomyces arxii TaxID=56418 RepID=UPI0034CD65E1
MSYTHHRGINVSEYIANLNAIEEPELSSVEFAQSPQQLSRKRQQEDLNLFANTQFFDFDMGRSTDAGVASTDELPVDDDRRRNARQGAQQFAQGGGASPSPAQVQGYMPQYIDLMSSPHVYPMPAMYDAMNSSLKRPSSTVEGLTPEDSSKYAADEDKRRRNTAASARFRIKKKQREQEMERTAKDLRDKVGQLENRIVQLEMENKWLKNLVVEKNEAKSVSEILNRPGQDVIVQAKEGNDR